MRHTLGIVLFVVLVLVGCWLVTTPTDTPPPAPAMTAATADSGASASAAIDATTTTGATTSTDAEANVDRTAAAHEAAAPSPFVRVRVRDADRKPIEGATVETFADSNPGRVETRADGWATLAVAPGKGELRLLVRAGDRHRQLQTSRRPELTVTLPWAGPLHGRVVDNLSGAPIASATVTLSHDTCAKCDADRRLTAPDGTFLLPAAPRNEALEFVFEHADYPRQTLRLQIPGRGEPLTHTFVLERGEVVAGRCVELDSRRPIHEAEVLIGGDTIAKTNVDGTFRALVRADPEFGVRLQLRRQGYCALVVTVTPPQPDDQVEYPLPRALELRGRVRTPQGEPLAGASVRASRDHDSKLPPGAARNSRIEDNGMISAKADADGNFVLSDLVPGASYRVWARLVDHQPPAGQPRAGQSFVPTPDAAPLDLQLERIAAAGSATITGTFRLNGKPSAGVLQYEFGKETRWASIDPEGAFKIERLPAGKLRLIATTQNYQRTTEAGLRVEREVELHADEALALTLDLTIEEATIRGRVTEADGTPVVEHAVWFSAAQGDFGASVETDEAGNYELRAPTCLPEVVVGCERAKSRDAVAPGATGVDFVLGPRGTLWVRATREDGMLADASFAVRAADGRYFQRTSASAPDPDGYLTLPATPGPIQLFVSAPDCVPQLLSVNVTTGSRLDVRLQRGTTVTIKLAKDHPEGDVPYVELLDANLGDLAAVPRWSLGMRVNRSCTPTAEGKVLRGVAPGRHSLQMRGRFEPVPAFVEVGTAPVTVEVSWRLQKPQQPR
ncbi:MAG: carboxypeptidase regulatory-like domain-containing protein [Planctomycetes bacterium]|nr:carboxypeptidase regulatory-like domain-containing protein [Planctomycetota bacterium]